MINNYVMWIALGISMLLDVLVVIVDASFSHARLPYLLNLREGREAPVEETVRLIEEPRLRTGLHLALTLLHFFIAGLLVLMMF
jgi:hypothetical protein